MLIGGDDISNDTITLGMCFSMLVYIGRFQKISIPYHGRLLGFPKGRGGFTIMEF